MLRVIDERDDLIEQIRAVTSAGKPVLIDVLEHKRLMRNDFDGSASWVSGMTWYRCNGIEVTPKDDGTWESDESQRLVLRRAS